MMVAYSMKMKNIHEKYPEDNTMAVLFAASIMDVTAWQWWLPEEGSEVVPSWVVDWKMEYKFQNNGTQVAIEILEGVIKREPENSGAVHYHIHVTEMAPTVMSAQFSGNIQAGMLPGNGHIQHMSTHIFARLGEYEKGIRFNINALLVDKAWALSRPGVNTYYWRHYNMHNLDFIADAAMFEGNHEYLGNAWEEVVEHYTFELTVAFDDTWPSQNHFLTRLMAFLRLGKYQYVLDYRYSKEVLSVALPGCFYNDDSLLVCDEEHLKNEKEIVKKLIAAGRDEKFAFENFGRVGRFVATRFLELDLVNIVNPWNSVAQQQLYAATVAYARLGNLDLMNKARNQYNICVLSLSGSEPTSQGTMTIPVTDALGDVYRHSLDMEMAMANDDWVAAEKAAEQAYVTLKTVPYDEPAQFFYPIGETYGKILIHNGKKDEAAQVFRSNLFVHPNSIGSVVGLWYATGEQSQGVKTMLERATLHNDTAITLEML